MASYNGLFIRSAIGQSNDIPRTGAIDTSPDIIPFGIGCVSDPAAVFSADYNEDPSKPLEANQANYIYLRAKNYSGSRIDDKDGNNPRMFWAKGALLLWPQTWTELNRSPNGRPFTLTADAGAIGVISEPFIWSPADISGDSYYLISLVPSPGYDNAIPDHFSTSEDFNNWVAGHGGVACRKVTLNNSGSMTFSNSIDFDMGDEGALITFVLACQDIPEGTLVSFSAGTPGAQPVVFLPPTPVKGSDFLVGLDSQIPAGYISAVYFNIIFPPQTTPPPGARVSLQAMYNAGEQNAIRKALVIGENHLNFN